MLWRLRAFYMMLRRNAPIAVFLALLLLVLPVRLGARPRTHAARSGQSPSRQGRIPEQHRASRAGRHASHIAAPARLRRHAPRLAKVVAVTAALPLHPAATGTIERPAAPKPEAAATGVSHPPDLDDMDSTPASVQEPGASGNTTQSPQLPPIEDVAATPAILPSLYNERGHLVVPPPLRGSHEILLRQNEVADRDGLARIQDDSNIAWMRRRAMLVALPVSGAMRVDERLPASRRYCRPWTAQFLATLARAHYAQFHTPLQVNSAVRTVAFQQRLLRTNGNAAPAGGETASPHLTGQAVDLAKRGLSLSEIAWMRGYLLPLVRAGKIDVEEEFQQACFHISVYKTYAPSPRREIAVTHRDRPAALAIAVQ